MLRLVCWTLLVAAIGTFAHFTPAPGECPSGYNVLCANGQCQRNVSACYCPGNSTLDLCFIDICAERDTCEPPWYFLSPEYESDTISSDFTPNNLPFYYNTGVVERSKRQTIDLGYASFPDFFFIDLDSFNNASVFVTAVHPGFIHNTSNPYVPLSFSADSLIVSPLYELRVLRNAVDVGVYTSSYYDYMFVSNVRIPYGFEMQDLCLAIINEQTNTWECINDNVQDAASIPTKRQVAGDRDTTVFAYSTIVGGKFAFIIKEKRYHNEDGCLFEEPNACYDGSCRVSWDDCYCDPPSNNFDHCWGGGCSSSGVCEMPPWYYEIRFSSLLISYVAIPNQLPLYEHIADVAFKKRQFGELQLGNVNFPPFFTAKEGFKNVTVFSGPVELPVVRKSIHPDFNVTSAGLLVVSPAYEFFVLRNEEPLEEFDRPVEVFSRVTLPENQNVTVADLCLAKLNENRGVLLWECIDYDVTAVAPSPGAKQIENPFYYYVVGRTTQLNGIFAFIIAEQPNVTADGCPLSLPVLCFYSGECTDDEVNCYCNYTALTLRCFDGSCAQTCPLPPWEEKVLPISYDFQNVSEPNEVSFFSTLTDIDEPSVFVFVANEQRKRQISEELGRLSFPADFVTKNVTTNPDIDLNRISVDIDPVETKVLRQIRHEDTMDDSKQPITSVLSSSYKITIRQEQTAIPNPQFVKPVTIKSKVTIPAGKSVSSLCLAYEKNMKWQCTEGNVKLANDSRNNNVNSRTKYVVADTNHFTVFAFILTNRTEPESTSPENPIIGDEDSGPTSRDKAIGIGVPVGIISCILLTLGAVLLVKKLTKGKKKGEEEVHEVDTQVAKWGKYEMRA